MLYSTLLEGGAGGSVWLSPSCWSKIFLRLLPKESNSPVAPLSISGCSGTKSGKFLLRRFSAPLACSHSSIQGFPRTAASPNNPCAGSSGLNLDSAVSVQVAIIYLQKGS